ncbi:MAG: DUF2281 domain-containing protein [Treponema sp.]
MPYEILEKIKTLPEQGVEEVMNFIDYTCYKYSNKSNDEKSEQKKDCTFIDKMSGILSKKEAKEFRENKNLKFKEFA